jgi:hypothetical protein
MEERLRVQADDGKDRVLCLSDLLVPDVLEILANDEGVVDVDGEAFRMSRSKELRLCHAERDANNPLTVAHWSVSSLGQRERIQLLMMQCTDKPIDVSNRSHGGLSI